MKIINSEYKHFYDNNRLITYRLVYKDIRHMYLRYDSKQNIFTITLGKWYSADDALRFIKANYSKLEKKHVKQDVVENDKNSIKIFNNKIETKIIKSSINKYELINNILFLKLKSEASKKQVIKKFIENIAAEYLKNRSFQLAKEFGLDLRSVKLKWFKNRWGHCVKSKKEICLSYELAKYDKSIIDAIVTHELAHLIYFNHQKEFKDLWKKYCPNYKNLIKYLNHNDDY